MTTEAVSRRFADDLDRIFGDNLPPRIGIAMSGGGDSMALAGLFQAWAADKPVTLAACAVDHGLRREAAREIDLAAAFCARTGIAFSVRTWSHDTICGNLQAQARRARYGLLADWAREAGTDLIALGHTADDQAETLLLRLARGSGVDGLGAMRPLRRAGGVQWLRPLLGLRRQALRDWLTASGMEWAEDPSNEDPRFDRIKARRLMTALEPLGLSADGLLATAAHMTRAREVLENAAQSAARRIARVVAGSVIFDKDGLAALPEETGTRLVAAALCWISRSPYRPRYDALIRALSQKSATLHGCLMLSRDTRLIVTRELSACGGGVEAASPWDARWRIEGPAPAGARVRALGEDGLRHCPDWRESGLPRQVLLATPALWLDKALIAAPIAGFGAGFEAKLEPGCDDFYASLVTH